MTKDESMAVTQMTVLDTVLFGGGMDIRQAISALQLDHLKYAVLARKEGLDWIADEIVEVVKS